MEFWLNWVILGVLFIIIEMFVLTLDFLGIGISALITAYIVYLNHYTSDNIGFVGVIFVFLSAVIVFIFRMFLYPLINKKYLNKPALSVDNMVGQHLIVQNQDGQNVAYYEGNFWQIVSDQELKDGDSIEVLEVVGGKLKVKKIF